MKLNKFIIKSATIALIVGTALPLAVAAQLGNPAGQAKQPKGQGRDFCTILTSGEAGNKQTAKYQAHEADMEGKRVQRGAKMDEKRAKRDTKLDERRVVADTRRDQVEAKLSELAQTDEQKQAVIAFQTAVQAAVQARRDAFDATNETFRNGLDQGVIGHQTSIDVIVETYKLQVEAAETQAKTDCEAEDADRAQIRTALLETVRVARDEMKAAMGAIENVGQTGKALQDVRKAAMETAKTMFHTAMEQAKSDLKAILEANKPPKLSDEDEE